MTAVPAMSGIHQFVPMLHRGDAVGRHTLRLRRLWRERGVESEIYVEMMDPDTRSETWKYPDYAGLSQPGDILVYQFATASAMAPWLAARPELLVVNYHNITPPAMFAAWDNQVALGQVRAQAELVALASRTTLAVADSAYNATHLAEAGFGTTAVVPPSAALDLVPRVDGPARPGATHGARWLSVGRLAPNKALEDVIAALAVTRRHADPDATLTIIGKPAPPVYANALRSYAIGLGLDAAVTFAGHASDATVAAAYAESDVLVVTSEHEGYCVPVVEAMAVGLPVVAFRQGAVPEVLGAAGVVVEAKDPYALSTTISALLGDADRLAAVIGAGRARSAELDLASAAARLADLIVSLVGTPSERPAVGARGRGARWPGTTG